MRSRLENILLGVLWLLAATLGTCFWFNTIYGFNIFCVQHWQTLAYLQASETPIKPSFYISFGTCVFITIFVLYFLTKPKFRKIIYPIKTAHKQNTSVKSVKSENITQQPVIQPTTVQQITKQEPATVSQQNSEPKTIPQPILARPPRLNLPAVNSYAAAPVPTQPVAKAPETDPEIATIRELFSQNGYSVKKATYINGWRADLIAIGTNETFWIGGIGATTIQIKNAIDKFNQVFSDTLEDVFIEVNGFSVNAPDASAPEFDNILLFNTIDDLSEFLENNQSPVPNQEEAENFEAYSEYIDAVIGNIGNL